MNTVACERPKLIAAMKKDAYNRCTAYLTEKFGPLKKVSYIKNAVKLPDGRIVQIEAEFPSESLTGAWHFYDMDDRAIVRAKSLNAPEEVVRRLNPNVDLYFLAAYRQIDAEPPHELAAAWLLEENWLHSNFYLVKGREDRKFTEGKYHRILVWEKDNPAINGEPTFEDLSQFKVF